MKSFLIAIIVMFPSLAFSQAVPSHEKGPVGSFTASASYIYGENLGGNAYNSIGWTATPEVNLVRHFGMQADFASYYVQDIYPGQSRFLMVAGPRYNLAVRSRVSPYVFAEGGEVRLTAQNTLFRDWEPTVKAGLGFDFRLSKCVAFTFIPGEYIGHSNLNNAPWSQDFSARAGITLSLFH